MVDLGAQYRRIKPEVDAAIARVIDAGHFIKGEDCTLFEAEFAAWCGAGHAVGVANGTDALILALRAYGVGPGDEVVTVANTFIATGEAILLNGARPVFVDVEAASFTMETVEPAAGQRSDPHSVCPMAGVIRGPAAPAGRRRPRRGLRRGGR